MSSLGITLLLFPISCLISYHMLHEPVQTHYSLEDLCHRVHCTCPGLTSGLTLSTLLRCLHTLILRLVCKARSTIDHQFQLPSVAQRTEGEYIETIVGWVTAIVSTLTWSACEYKLGELRVTSNLENTTFMLYKFNLSNIRLMMKINIDWCRPYPSRQVSTVTWDQPFPEWVRENQNCVGTGHVVNTQTLYSTHTPWRIGMTSLWV